MSFNPKVSIIIPVYNGSNYLREAIDSALAQTYKNIEIIVVNDGSNDGGKTEAIALSYGDRIRYFYKENGGVASALNLGISKAEGEYISWLSHDDVYYPNKIELQINQLTSGEKNIVLYSDYDYIDSESKLTGAGKIGYINPDFFRYALTTSHPIHGCTVLIPKHCFDECGFFDESLRTTQDYDMWFRMAKKYRFVHMPKNLIKSRAHAEQSQQTMNTLHISECDYLLSKFIKNLTEEELLLSTGKNLSLSYAEVAANFYRRGFFKAAKVAANLSKRSFFYKTFFMGIEMLKFIYRSFSFASLRRNYSNSTKEHFTKIYHKNFWGDKHSRSGTGSNLKQTDVIRQEIPKIIEEFGVEIFIDAPCGDFFWMNTVNLDVRKYIGIDIVDDIIYG